jgi:hypothetical protein
MSSFLAEAGTKSGRNQYADGDLDCKRARVHDFTTQLMNCLFISFLMLLISSRLAQVAGTAGVGYMERSLR